MNPPPKSVRKAGRAAAAPSQGRSAATREKLLKSATAGFAREGFDGCSSRMIAGEADIHHALIAYHFGGKLGLWKACLMQIIEDHRQHLAARQAEAVDDTGRLKIMFEEFIRFNARNPAFQALMIDAAGSSDGRFDWVMTTLGRGENARWHALVESAQAAGRFVEGDPAVLLNIYYGAATRMYVMAAEVQSNLRRSPFEPEFVEEHVRTCLTLFFRDGPAPGRL